MPTNVKTVRDRLAHFLNPDTAQAVGLSLQQLQQVCAGTVALSDEQLRVLARRMGVQS